MRRLTALGAALGAVFMASSAQAQGKGSFGEQGQFIFSAERLFGLFGYDQNTFSNNNVNPNASVSDSGTSVSLFYGANSIGLGAAGVGVGAGVPNFYTVPRLGFDYTVIPNLTIGGDLIVFFTLGGNTSTSAGNTSNSVGNPGGNTFGIAPRVGYILGMSDLLSIWLRAGIHYYNGNSSVADTGCQNSSGNDTANVNVFGLDLDPQLVISPVSHVAFTLGPALDWGFAGGASTSTPDTPNCGSGNKSTNYGYTAVNFGINGGLLAWF